ncbi:hypothetical protein [Echinicola pacifica]|nr:hypothetical protein [Echinicola pacifica]
MSKESIVSKDSPLIVGILFLTSLWWLGYTGPAFSDDISYLHFGYNLFAGIPNPEPDNFSLRWGAFWLPGLLLYIFNFSDHLGSLASLIYTCGSLSILYFLLPERFMRITLVVFFTTNVYLIHFINQVFPDSALLLWVTLIPAALYRRGYKPMVAALLVALGFWMGMNTKETIIYLLPLPLVLLVFDFYHKRSLVFYIHLAAFTILFGLIYFGYFYLFYDDPFYKFISINEAHYIGEFSYYDKSVGTIFSRVSYRPLMIFISRTYWIWIILAVPGILRALKNPKELHFVFAVSSLCLLLGFLFMSTSFSFYNPIHLNPRHLIILIPSLSVNIALEIKRWTSHYFWKRFVLLWICFAAVVSFALVSWQYGLFYSGIAACFLFKRPKLQVAGIASILVFTTIYAEWTVKEEKQYEHMVSMLKETIAESGENTPIITHALLCQAAPLIFHSPIAELPLLDITALEEKIEADDLQEEFYVFTYSYLSEITPQDNSLLSQLQKFGIKYNYSWLKKHEDPWVSIYHLKKTITLPTFPDNTSTFGAEMQ